MLGESQPNNPPLANEVAAGGFQCAHCKHWVVINDFIGTANRNHCNVCLWSKHVDEDKGDRKATCGGDMEPIGLTFKKEGAGKQGELMVIHHCTKCGKLSINRIAGDDLNEQILSVFHSSLTMPNELKTALQAQHIRPLNEQDASEIHTQLFGK